MSDDELKLRTANWHLDENTLRELRENVFVHEQGVPADIEWDGKDHAAEHVIAERKGQALACGRIMPDGKIGRMAVLRDARNSGIGARVLDTLLQLAMRQGLRTVYLHAQAHAADFYARQGFVAEGDPFMEAGIEHIAMRLVLDYSRCRVDVPRADYPRPFGDLVLALLDTARRHVDILSPALDPVVFDNEAIASAISALVRRSRAARVRILVSDARALTTRGHRLLALSRRLPSRVQLQHLVEHPDWCGQSVVIRDRDGLLFTSAGEQSGGSFRCNDRAAASREREAFEELWRQSVANPEFRSLSL